MKDHRNNTITVKYCAYSNTLRQMPCNYMIAKEQKNDFSGDWSLSDFDTAANKELLHIVLDVFRVYDNRRLSGEKLAELINGMIK